MTAAGLDNNDWSCSQTGPALLIMETQHPSSRRTKQADITFPMLYCPLENINARLVCIEGNGGKNKREDGDDVVEVGCR